MSKLVKFIGVAALIAGAIAVSPGPALAQHHGGHGGWHGSHGGSHGGWRGGGWGGGFGFGWGAYPYYYGGPYYYAPEPECGWVRVRVLHHGRWVLRRAWRCWR